jgi:hypothetical protein
MVWPFCSFFYKQINTTCPYSVFIIFPPKSWLTKFPSGDQIFALGSHLATEKKYINRTLIMLPRMQRYEKSQFQCLITSLPLVLEQKIVLTGYRKSYPRNWKMCSYFWYFSNLTFDLNFNDNLDTLQWLTFRQIVLK